MARSRVPGRGRAAAVHRRPQLTPLSNGVEAPAFGRWCRPGRNGTFAATMSLHHRLTAGLLVAAAACAPDRGSPLSPTAPSFDAPPWVGAEARAGAARYVVVFRDSVAAAD